MDPDLKVNVKKVEYDFDAILNNILHIQRVQNDWYSFFAVWGIKPEPLLYETFSIRPETEFLSLLRELDIEAPKELKIETKVQPITTELNNEFKIRIREDFLARLA